MIESTGAAVEDGGVACVVTKENDPARAAVTAGGTATGAMAGAAAVVIALAGGFGVGDVVCTFTKVKDPAKAGSVVSEICCDDCCATAVDCEAGVAVAFAAVGDAGGVNPVEERALAEDDGACCESTIRRAMRLRRPGAPVAVGESCADIVRCVSYFTVLRSL